MSTHVMIDLETLGTGNYAAILSIGACKFDPQGDDISERFHVHVDPESCQNIGMRIDAPTVMWWLHPDRAPARLKLIGDEGTTRHPIQDALDGFAQWFGKTSLPTWGNGSDFDNVILRNAFTLSGMACPWEFWDNRCFRTYKSLTSFRPPREGTAHDALDDAVYQAETLQMITKHLGLTP